MDQETHKALNALDWHALGNRLLLAGLGTAKDIGVLGTLLSLEDVEDLVAVAIETVISGKASWDRNREIYPLLKTILKRRLVDQIRRCRSDRPPPSSEPSDGLTNGADVLLQSAESDAKVDLRVREVVASTDDDEEAREVVEAIMTDGVGYMPRGIAKHTGYSVPAVNTILIRIRRRARKSATLKTGVYDE